ncbi:MAG: DUF3795 domain-containing protein [Nitrospirota bacterium]|nr:MAG: DUF3795 domain-containing protein [Nitrospirota bacterium]
MKKSNDDPNIDKRLAAVCGLLCEACHVYIATQEDPERLEVLSKHYQKPLEELRCNGCRSDSRCFYCNTVCFMSGCAKEKGVDFCGECSDYPCDGLKAFQAEAPHRIELWKNQERIKEAGYEQWYTEMIEHYSCSACGTINSAYDISCRRCGASPSCEYVKLHKEAIMNHLEKRK